MIVALMLIVPLLFSAVPASAAIADGWATAQLVETIDEGSASAAQIAVDGSGNAVAVWSQHDGTRYNIYANWYHVGTGWSAEALIETNGSADAQSPEVAVDRSGNALAVWSQSDGETLTIWANGYVPGTGWGTARRIDAINVIYGGDPQVAFDASGNAFAVWNQYDGQQPNSIWANRYVAGVGWGTAGVIEADNSGQDMFAELAVDAGGNAIAVWVQALTSTDNVKMNMYVKGTGWGIAQLLETDDGAAHSPRVAFDGSGNAIVVWNQHGLQGSLVYAKRYVAGTGWGTPVRIGNIASGGNAQVAFDGSGNAVAVWMEHEGGRYNIWANRYVAGAGWGTAVLIETDNAGTTYDPQVAVDGRGNAVAVWMQDNATRYAPDIWANRYEVGTGWRTAGLLETGTGAAYFPQVAVDSFGHAVAVWEQSDGTRSNIWANRLVEVCPPFLSLDSPRAGFGTNKSAVVVAGATDPGANLSVNGYNAAVAANGSFRLLLPLSPGVNVINATVRNDCPETVSVSVDVTFNDLLPGLEAEVAALEAELEALESALGAAQAALAVALGDLDAARNNLTSLTLRTNTLESELAATTGALEAARTDLSAAESRLAATEADQNATEAELEAARAGVADAQARVAELEGTASVTTVALATTQRDLAAAAARIAPLEASLNATMVQVAVAEAAIDDALDALSLAEARIATLEAAETSTSGELEGARSRAATAQGTAWLALAVGVLGILVGGLGVAMAFRARRAGESGRYEESSSARRRGPQSADPRGEATGKGPSQAPGNTFVDLLRCPGCGSRIEAFQPQCHSCRLALSWA